MADFARLGQPYRLPYGLGDHEISLDIRSERRDRRAEFGRDERLDPSRIAASEADYASAGMRVLQYITKRGDPAGVAWLRMEQGSREFQVVAEIVARDVLVGGKKPDAGASAKRSGVRPGEKFFSSAVGARRGGRQDRRNLRGIEIVAGEAQRHERLAVGFRVSLRRTGCRSSRHAYR